MGMRSPFANLLRLVSVAGVLWLAPSDAQAQAPTARDAEARVSPVRVTGVWAGFQLLPVADFAVSEGVRRGGLHWQVTPLLFSWSRDPRVSRWRFLVAEPTVRHGGSLELVVAPGLFFEGRPSASVRALTRATFPLAEHGERASVSLGAGYGRLFRQDTAVVEAGLYALFGIVGVRAAWMPRPGELRTFVLSFQLRYF
ncbi:MAG: hypothetical protein AAGH15_14150 [Myxococcota bacterium]